MKLTAQEFYNLTPREFSFALDDWMEQENRKVDWDQGKIKSGYEIARFVLFHLLNISGKSLKRNLKSLKEVFEFDWENEQKQKNELQSSESMKRWFASFARSHNKRIEKNEHRRIACQDNGRHRSNADCPE